MSLSHGVEAAAEVLRGPTRVGTHVFVTSSLAAVLSVRRQTEVHSHFMWLQHVSKQPGGGNVAVGKIKSLLRFLPSHWSLMLKCRAG